MVFYSPVISRRLPIFGQGLDVLPSAYRRFASSSVPLVMSLLLVLGALGLPSAFAAEPPPNFVVILADDCTYRDLGCYGGQARTPHIDQLAREGMRFQRCFQSAPMCSPTRHALYTSLYPVRSGAYPNHTFVYEGTRSVAHYLKDAGYRVALSGKKHINPPSSFPFEFSGVRNNPDPAAIEKLFRECADDSTPFCLFACSNEPHTPWDRGDPEQYDADTLTLPPYFADTRATREAMTRYLAEITFFDQQVGQITDLLSRFELEQNTVLVVLTEQGSSFPFAKWTCYETGLQSGCLVRWPGQVAAGSTTNAMVDYIDLVPTFLEAAGEEIPEGLDGRSLLPVLTGMSNRHRDYIYGEMTTRGIINGSDTYGIRSVRDDRYKLIRNLSPEVPFQNACTQSPEFRSWLAAAARGNADAADKVRRYQFRPEYELYDLQSDPFEWRNRIDDPELAEISQRLSSQLASWMAHCGDQGQETEQQALSRLYRNRSGRQAKPRRKK